MDTEQNHNILTKFVLVLRALFLSSLSSGALGPKLEQLPGPRPTSSPPPSQSELYPLIQLFPTAQLVPAGSNHPQYVPGTRLGAGPVEIKGSPSPKELPL